MAETKRTSTDLLTNLFQDGQAAGAISEQDLRDLIASLILPYGGCYMDGNTTETVINTQGVFEPIAGTFTANADLSDFTVSTAGVLTYTGTPDRYITLLGNASITAAANSKDVYFKWFLNGTTPIQAKAGRKVGTGADLGNSSFNAGLVLSTNDTVQAKVMNNTDTANITVNCITLLVDGKFI